MKKILQKISSQKGVTLIEFILYIGIFSILLVVLFQLLSSVFDVQVESQSTSSLAEDGLFLLNRINYDIQSANKITTPGSSGSSSATLVLDMKTSNYTYKITSGNLVITDSLSGTDQLNSLNTSVSNLNFTRLSDTKGYGTDTITASFTLTSRITKRTASSFKNFKSTIGVRPKP